MAALLEGEAEALTRKAVELALQGNALALKLCLDRLHPPRRDPPVAFSLPSVASAEDLARAMAAIAAAVAAGELTPAEAFDLRASPTVFCGSSRRATRSGRTRRGSSARPWRRRRRAAR